MERIPAHVAIIMDGNGRFATKQGFMRLWGHHQGYKTLKGVLLDSANLGIKYLTVYAFSAENWRRPESEVSGLMKLIEDAARRELKDLKSNNVRVKVIGRKSELPESLQDAIRDMEDSTESNTGITFTLAINYGGRAEIVDAVSKIIESGIPHDQISEELIAQNLYNHQLPDPDLMIRTAGELRWSNFLIWQAAYSELFVTDTNWPEFGEQELLQAVHQYQKRVRKFGGLA